MKTLLLFATLFLPTQDPTQEDIESWIEALSADYQDERTEAYRKLEKAGKKAEKALIDSVTHEDFRVRRAVIELLTKIKSKKVVEPVARIFKEDEDLTVQEVAFAYLQMCGLAAEDHLIAILDHKNETYRLGALSTLQKEKSQKCAKKVAQLYDREQNPTIKQAAFDCLKQIGKAAKPFLLDLLKSKDASVRLGALDGLVNIKAEDDDAVTAVTNLFLVESAPDVQLKAFDYLKGKGARAEPAFLRGLESVQERIRFHSARGLREMKSVKALDSVAKLFKTDPSSDVRKEALEYLKVMGKKSEKHLMEALDSEIAHVRHMAIEGLGVIKSSIPLERISRMFREDPDAKVHRLTFNYLKNVGMPAEDDLIHALKDTVPEIRKEAIQRLGNLKSHKSIEPLMGILKELNPDIRDAARDALVRIGKPAVDAVKAAAKAGKLKRKLANLIVLLFNQELVEVILDRLITPQGGTGFYAGQFDELKAFGVERAAPVLIKMIQPDFQVRLEAKKGVTSYRYTKLMRELAIMALGELDVKSALTKLKSRIRQMREMNYGDDEYEELVIAAYRLGDLDSYKQFVKQRRRQAAEDLKRDYKSYDRLFSLAMTQNRVGEREDSLKTYQSLRKVIEQNKEIEKSQVYDACLYNIACLLSLTGKKAEAIKTLRESVVAGFKDREWIKMDKDLDPLRGEAEFKALLKDKKLFELRKGNP